MKSVFSLAALIALAFNSAPAAAQTDVRLRTNQIRVVHEEPQGAKHRAIRDMMQERGVLALLQDLLSSFRLPRPLTLEVKSCGREDAYYSEGKAVLCYEYVELIQRHTPKVATLGGVVRADAVVGGIIDTLLHEVGHGIIDMLDIPVLGREEDAADFFSVYMLLQFPPEDAQRLIQGVGFMMASEARENLEERPRPKSFAGSHGMPAQRYYNLLCLAYGADPETFADAMRDGLPAWRAGDCGDEHALLKRAFSKLILPYIDEVKLREAIARARFNWSPLATAKDSFDAPPLAD